MNFFKANEKVIMVVMLAILAPTFTMTGLMQSFFGQSAGDRPVYRVYGNVLHSSDFQQLVNQQMVLGKVATAQVFGSGLGRRGASDEQVLDHYVFMEEARRRGIVVTQKEMEDAIQDVGVKMIAFKKVLDEGGFGPDADNFKVFQRVNEVQGNTVFDAGQYRDALRDPRLGFNMSVMEFENALEELLTAAKVRRIAEDLVVVSEKEVYAEYEKDKEKRIFEFVRIPSDKFQEAALASVTDDERKQRYEERPGAFNEPNKIKLEIAKTNSAELRNSFEVTEEEIVARYEKDKGSRYLAAKKPPTSQPADGGAEAAAGTDEPQYRPLADVRESVLTSIRATKEKELVEKALADAKAKEGEFSLLDLFGENVAYVEKFETNFFSLAEIRDLPTTYQHMPTFNRLLMANRFPELKVGSMGDQVVNVSGGAYIYRIVGKQDQRTPTLEECRDQVSEAIAKDKAMEFALNSADEAVLKIESNADTTLESFAKENEYTVHRTEALASTDSNKVKVDGNRLNGGFAILREGFAIDEPGLFATATAFDKSEAYLVRFAESVAPDSAGFADLKASLENRVRSRKMSAARSDFEGKVRAAAAIDNLMQGAEQP